MVPGSTRCSLCKPAPLCRLKALLQLSRAELVYLYNKFLAKDARTLARTFNVLKTGGAPTGDNASLATCRSTTSRQPLILANIIDAPKRQITKKKKWYSILNRTINKGVAPEAQDKKE